MKLITSEQLTPFLYKLSEIYRLILPVKQPDGGRTLGTLSDGEPSLIGGMLPAKPTAPFFLQSELLFSINSDGKAELQEEPEKHICLIGYTAADLRALAFVDRFFAEEPEDSNYMKHRADSVVVGLSGYVGAGGACLAPAAGMCDLELFFDRENWLAIPYTEIGKSLIIGFPDSPNDSIISEIPQELLENKEESVLLHASEILKKSGVPDHFWDELGERCISCTGCTAVCPTCSCFGVEDYVGKTDIKRLRMWDSCQLDGFMREAGGHNPLGTKGLRSRRRIHHKLVADVDKWGEIGCVCCGRCDAACPTGIGMLAVAKEIVRRFGG